MTKVSPDYVNFGDTVVIKYGTNTNEFMRKRDNETTLYFSTDTKIPVAIFQIRNYLGQQKETNTRNQENNILTYDTEITLGVFLSSDNDYVRNYFVDNYWTSDYNSKRIYRYPNKSSSPCYYPVALKSNNRDVDTLSSMRLGDRNSERTSAKIKYGDTVKIYQYQSDGGGFGNVGPKSCAWTSDSNNKFCFGEKIEGEDARARTKTLYFYRYGCTVDSVSTGIYGNWCADCIMKDNCTSTVGRDVCYNGVCIPKCFNDSECDGICSAGLCVGECKNNDDCIDAFCESNICISKCYINDDCRGICNYEQVGQEFGECIGNCKVKSDCDNGYHCVDNFCVEGCNNCLGVCINAECIGNCTISTDCNLGEICVDNFCIAECNETNCPGHCDDNECKPNCASDSECHGICRDGSCYGDCKTHTNCETNQTCVSNFCSVECTLDEQCDGICEQNSCIGDCRFDNECGEEMLCVSNICTKTYNETAIWISLSVLIFIGIMLLILLFVKIF